MLAIFVVEQLWWWVTRKLEVQRIWEGDKVGV
jgi:hypothetical protein